MEDDEMNYGILPAASSSGTLMKNEEEYIEDKKWNEERQNYGLPASFGGNSGLSREGTKQYFYCHICMTELNSEETMISHRRGQKHLKKVQEHKFKNSLPENPIVEREPPKKIIKKNPTRLRDKLSSETGIIVGLRFIEERIAISDREMEPNYTCTICSTIGESNCMLNHLNGNGHKKKFLMKMNPHDEKYIEMKTGNYNRELSRYHDKTEKFAFTDYTVDRYPWPPSKAPWAFQNGGTGDVPSKSSLGTLNGSKIDLCVEESIHSRIEKIRQHLDVILKTNRNRVEIPTLGKMLKANIDTLEQLVFTPTNGNY